MFEFKKQIKKISESLNLKKEKLVILAISVIFFMVMTWLSSNQQFFTILAIITIFLLVVLLFMIMSMAGFTVIKPLFAISAELSFLIFLAQSYCTVPDRSNSGNQALRSLLAFGLLYLTYIFLDSFFDTIKKGRESVKNEIWNNEKIILVVFYLVFVILFMWNVMQVVSPIINDLCVYKKLEG